MMMKTEAPKISDLLTESNDLQDIVQQAMDDEEDIREFHFTNANM